MTTAHDPKETRRVIGKGVIQPGSLAEKGVEYAKASGAGRKQREAGFKKKILFF